MNTEGEAKTKWCPFAHADAVAQERVPPGATAHFSERTRCIGSACMAWRWEMTLESGSNYPHHRPPHWHRWRYIDAHDPATEGEIKTDRGHCGLAGKP